MCFRATALRIEKAKTTPYPESDTQHWRVATGDNVYAACAVVIATGRNHTPYLPAWPGIDSFHGTLLHSSEYRNPKPYQGRTELVVGAGNSGAEIAAALALVGQRGCGSRSVPLPISFRR